MKEVRSSKIDPYVQGRVFAFSDLLPVWQRAFLTKVGIRFKQIAAGLAQETPKAPYLQLVELLRWIGESENPQCERF